MTAYEYGDDIFIVDCGMAFPDADMLGVDIVIPDFTYLEKTWKKSAALSLLTDTRTYRFHPLFSKENQCTYLRREARLGTH